jgi:hypothetical protein
MAGAFTARCVPHQLQKMTPGDCVTLPGPSEERTAPLPEVASACAKAGSGGTETPEVETPSLVNVTYASAASFVISAERPHMVQVVAYFVPRGSTGMKNNVNHLRILVMAWAAGVWQNAHIIKTVANRARMRLKPNRMIIFAPLPEMAPLKFGEQHHLRRYKITTPAQLFLPPRPGHLVRGLLAIATRLFK